MIARKILNSVLTCVFLLFTLVANSQSYDIYVSDAGDFQNGPWQIIKFDSNGQNPVTFINNNLNWPQDILFIEDSNYVLISNFGSGKISRYNATNGTYLNDFATGISGPTRMKIGPDSLLYVLQWFGNGRVKRYKLSGTFVDDFTATGVPESIGIDWDTTGNLYVSSYNGDFVRKFDTSGVDLGVFVSNNLVGPTNIWFDSNGDLLVSDYDGTAVKRFNASGIYQNDFLSGTSKSEGVAFLPNGNILIGNGATHSVRMYSSSGSYLKDLITNGSGNLMNPNAIVIRKKMNVSVSEINPAIDNVVYPSIGSEFYISDQYKNTIRTINILNSEGSLVDTFNHEMWIAKNYSNGVYILLIQFTDGTTISQKIIVKK